MWGPRGQDPEAEDAEAPPRLDALALHWWSMQHGDYVAACQVSRPLILF